MNHGTTVYGQLKVCCVHKFASDQRYSSPTINGAEVYQVAPFENLKRFCAEFSVGRLIARLLHFYESSHAAIRNLWSTRSSDWFFLPIVHGTQVRHDSPANHLITCYAG